MKRKVTIAMAVFLVTVFSFGITPSHACDITKIRDELETHYEEAEISKPLTVSEIEKRQTVSVQVDGKMREIPFGYINHDWEEFKKKINPEDCIIHFKTGEKSWNNLYGREGHILIRNKEIVVIIYTTVS